MFITKRRTLRDFRSSSSSGTTTGGVSNNNCHRWKEMERTIRRIILQWVPKSRRDRIQLLRIILLLVIASITIYKFIDRFLRWKRMPKYSSRKEMNFRNERFPSIDDRVRIYMLNWYKPPCSPDDQITYQRISNGTSITKWSIYGPKTTDDIYYRIKELPSAFDGTVYPQRDVIIPKKIQIGRIFYMDREQLQLCHDDHWSIRYYCSDAMLSMLDDVMPKIKWIENVDTVPLMCQYSDETESFGYVTTTLSDDSLYSNPRIPHIKKIRLASSREEIDRITKDGKSCHSGPRIPPIGQTDLQPIVWLLNIERHFKYSRDVPRYDIPWNEKKDASVFRGLLTGLEYNPDATDDDNCHVLIRCRLVYETATSTIVDAKLTSTFDKVPEIFHGVNLTGDLLKKEELLEYKGFIILEGNDVSSGLKWAMVSKSVVLMPPPRFSSWSMEELLEPWVHYIPLNNDLSDVVEKTQWMIDHPTESQRISHRANLWILDLYFHPNAMDDNKRINEEILKRYRTHFREEFIS